MAFRKSVRSFYCPAFSVHHFGDYRMKQTSVDVESRVFNMQFSTSKEISKEALPLINLDSIINSGEVIKGNVSLRPSDPACIGRDVSDSVTSYIDKVQSSIDSIKSE